MTQEETLLVMLAEECAELQHAIAKTLRFGMEGESPDGIKNKDQLRLEFNDVLAVAEILQTKGIAIGRDVDLISRKIDKVREYI